MISKDAEGEVSVKSPADEDPIGTAFGMLMGAMERCLPDQPPLHQGRGGGQCRRCKHCGDRHGRGRPTGGVFGAYRDLWISGMDLTILNQVGTELLPGKTCIVASVDEVWTTPLDTKIKETGDKISKRAREMDAEFGARLTAIDDQIANAGDRLKAKYDKHKAEIQADRSRRAKVLETRSQGVR